MSVGLAWDRSSLNCDGAKIALTPTPVRTDLVRSVTGCKPNYRWLKSAYAKLKIHLRFAQNVAESEVKARPVRGALLVDAVQPVLLQAARHQQQAAVAQRQLDGLRQ